LFYVYLIESVAAEGQRYVGATADLKVRLQQHNAGQSAHTAKYKPWHRELRRILQPRESRRVRAIFEVGLRARVCCKTALVNPFP
jgi:predicted GIY-YIG superfamily endonuclease